MVYGGAHVYNTPYINNISFSLIIQHNLLQFHVKLNN